MGILIVIAILFVALIVFTWTRYFRFLSETAPTLVSGVVPKIVREAYTGTDAPKLSDSGIYFILTTYSKLNLFAPSCHVEFLYADLRSPDGFVILGWQSETSSSRQLPKAAEGPISVRDIRSVWTKAFVDKFHLQLDHAEVDLTNAGHAPPTPMTSPVKWVVTLAPPMTAKNISGVGPENAVDALCDFEKVFNTLRQKHQI